MSAVFKDTPMLREHVLLSPEGRVVRIAEFIFKALMEFVDNKHTGSVEVHFKDGGFSAAECCYRRSYRNGKGEA